MISDANRRHLHDRLVPAIGPEASEILMDSQLASVDARFGSMDSQFASIDARIDSKVDAAVAKVIMANIAAMISLAALIIAAGALF